MLVESPALLLNLLQDGWRQHVTGGKLKDTTDEARTFAIGNKSLASLFVHTPAGYTCFDSFTLLLVLVSTQNSHL